MITQTYYKQIFKYNSSKYSSINSHQQLFIISIDPTCQTNKTNENLKYFKNDHCVMANKREHQDIQVSHKTTN